jgi:hypothetical protein
VHDRRRGHGTSGQEHETDECEDGKVSFHGKARSTFPGDGSLEVLYVAEHFRKRSTGRRERVARSPRSRSQDAHSDLKEEKWTFSMRETPIAAKISSRESHQQS